MATYNHARGGSGWAAFGLTTKWLNFLFIALIICIGVPWLIRIIRNQSIKNELNINDNDIKLAEQMRNDPEWALNQAEALVPGEGQFFLDMANRIAHNLGTCYPWYNWRSWSENEHAVIQDFRDNFNTPVPEGTSAAELQLNKLGKVYSHVAAPGHHLGTDLNRYMPTNYLEEIAEKYTGSNRVYTYDK